MSTRERHRFQLRDPFLPPRTGRQPRPGGELLQHPVHRLHRRDPALRPWLVGPRRADLRERQRVARRGRPAAQRAVPQHPRPQRERRLHRSGRTGADRGGRPGRRQDRAGPVVGLARGASTTGAPPRTGPRSSPTGRSASGSTPPPMPHCAVARWSGLRGRTTSATPWRRSTSPAGDRGPARGSAHPETLEPVHVSDRAHGEERYPVGVPAPANRA